MRDDHPTTPPRAEGAGPRAGALPAPPAQGRAALAVPLPAGAVMALAARAGLTVEDIGARLGLAGAQLLAFDQAGGPGWLRLALIGIAVERGAGPEALAWLAPSPAEPTAPNEEPP